MTVFQAVYIGERQSTKPLTLVSGFRRNDTGEEIFFAKRKGCRYYLGQIFEIEHTDKGYHVGKVLAAWEDQAELASWALDQTEARTVVDGQRRASKIDMGKLTLEQVRNKYHGRARAQRSAMLASVISYVLKGET
jgi:hypothetical protein